MQPRRSSARTPKSDGGDHAFGNGVAAGSGANEQIGNREFPRRAVLIDGDWHAQDGDRTGAWPAEVCADCKLDDACGRAAIKDPRLIRCWSKRCQQIFTRGKHDWQGVNRDFGRLLLWSGGYKSVGLFLDGVPGPIGHEYVARLVHGHADGSGQSGHHRSDQIAGDGEFFDGTVTVVTDEDISAVVHREVVGIAEVRERGDGVPIRNDAKREHDADSQLLHGIITNVRSIERTRFVHRHTPGRNESVRGVGTQGAGRSRPFFNRMLAGNGDIDVLRLIHGEARHSGRVVGERCKNKIEEGGNAYFYCRAAILREINIAQAVHPDSVGRTPAGGERGNCVRRLVPPFDGAIGAV